MTGIGYSRRLDMLRANLHRWDAAAIYVTKLTNVRYLCGFTGSAGSLLVAGDGAWFFTDGRYRTQAPAEVQEAEVEVRHLPEDSLTALARRYAQLGRPPMAVEAAHLSLTARDRLATALEPCELVGAEGAVEDLRRCKEPAELELMRTAAELADAGFAFICGRVSPGRSERELALELEFHLRSEGADDVSFDPIVAAGEHSALPHARPGDRLVEKGELLLFDLGCVYRGYCSDMTRTVVVGNPDSRQSEIYSLVLAAQKQGIEAVRPRPAFEVDRAARSVIEEAGYGEAFVHGLGHGVGLEIHEDPAIRSTNTGELLAGDVVTVEPGIYLPDWGGVRIEDLVVVLESGCELLSRSPKELVSL